MGKTLHGWSAGTGNFNHQGKWQMEHSFFFVFYQYHIKPTSSVHDMNFVKTKWGTCFLIFLLELGALWDGDTKL